MTHVRALWSREEFLDIRKDWDQLYERQTDRRPFIHWIWFDAFWADMDLSGREVFILTAWRDDRLIGAAPLTRERRAFIRTHYWEVRGLENDHSEYYHWLLPADPNEALETARAFLGELKRICGRHHYFALNQVYRSAPPTSILKQALRQEGYMISERRFRYPPRVRFPQGYAALMETLSKNTRKRLRNSRNRLERMTGVSFDEVASWPQCMELLDRCLELERKSWKGRAGTSILQSPRLTAFYRRLTTDMRDSGLMALFITFCGREPAAFNFSLVDNGVVHLCKGSVDEGYDRISLEQLNVEDIIRWAENHGITELGYGGEAEPYKRHWTREGNQAGTIFAFPGTYGRFLYLVFYGWKDALKRLPIVTRIVRERAERKRRRAMDQFKKPAS